MGGKRPRQRRIGHEWLRNRDTTISTCSGFYFMKMKGHVIHVGVRWDDYTRKFHQTMCRWQAALSPDCVLQDKGGLKRGKRSLLNALQAAAKKNPTSHALPISTRFISEFGNRAFQTLSGLSVVIIDPDNPYLAI